MKKISIIVAIYNVSEYLNRCLDSVIKQKGNDIEIILIDDGSTDDSLNICKMYQKKDKRIKIIHQENKGLSRVRNVGYDNSSGEYIWHIDGDDYLKDNAIDIIREYLNKYDIICFNYYDDINGKVDISNKYEDKYVNYILGKWSIWNKVIKRSVLEKERFPEGCSYNDIYVTLGLVNDTKSIIFIKDYLYNYTYRKDSLSNKRIFNIKDLLYCLDKVYNKLNNDYYEEVEFLYISNILFYNIAEYVKYNKKFKFIEFNKIVKQKFPKYYKNKYWNNSGLGRKIYIRLMYYNMFFVAIIIMFIKLKIYNKNRGYYEKN